MITSFIQDSADKHIPSKNSRMVSSVPWITSEIRRKIPVETKHTEAKKTGSKKLRSKFETLRREIKDDVRKQHDLYANNFVGDVKQILETSIGTSIVRKKDNQGIPPLKKEEELASQLQKLNRLRNLSQFTDVFNKMIIVRFHFSVGWSLLWMTLLFQMRV